MIKKVLIVNRGEIACRVIETAKLMGIQAAVVHSEVDSQSRAVRMANEAVQLVGKTARETYLNIEAIIDVAKRVGADAVHPGYGFLSENAEFARACEQAGIIFIGPPATAIEAMGSKSRAKSIMESAGVPLVPGYHGDDQSLETLKDHADEMGYPVLLKATAGGGGKGMRAVTCEAEFSQAFESAKREASSSFGDDRMLVERLVQQPRHIEVQVFCDTHGNAVYLFERDCSIQRRHQKIVEEAPAPGLTDELRRELGEAAVQAARAIDYVGAGTVEFLLDAEHRFYFMEMNTRLQVEHPVTEMVTDTDLVEWQFRVAQGEPLPLQQDEITLSGHAIEVRLYAEDPYNQFLPSTGRLTTFGMSENSVDLRLDTGVEAGDEVTAYYDPMLAKLIARGASRFDAVRRLRQALESFHCDGVVTNTRFLRDILNTEAFSEGGVDTGFIEQYKEQLLGNASIDLSTQARLASAYFAHQQAHSGGDSLWHRHSGWRVNQPAAQTVWYRLGESVIKAELTQLATMDGSLRSDKTNTMRLTAYIVTATESGCFENSKTLIEAEPLEVEVADNELAIRHLGHLTKVSVSKLNGRTAFYLPQASFVAEQYSPLDAAASQQVVGDSAFTAPMNGRVIEVLVSAGDEVEAGASLVVMEAMKMQHTIMAPASGTVDALNCSAGALVSDGQVLLEFTAGE